MNLANSQLTNQIVATGSALLRAAGRLLKPYGITAPQFNVLKLVVDEPQGLRPSEIAAKLVVDPSSTTYLLDQLQEKGWLKRVAVRDDRRAWQITATAAGRKKWDQVKPVYLAALQKTLQEIGPIEIGPMTESLLRIQQAAESAVDQVLAAQPIAERARKK